MAEPRPDMNIKVAAFTVNEKSSNIEEKRKPASPEFLKDHTGKCIRLDDRYSNLFLNAYINHRAHTEYLKLI